MRFGLHVIMQKSMDGRQLNFILDAIELAQLWLSLEKKTLYLEHFQTRIGKASLCVTHSSTLDESLFQQYLV